MKQNPSIGRIVHFCNALSSEVHAAMITRVCDAEPSDGPKGVCSLVVHGPDDDYRQGRAPYADSYKPGCWTWPPLVK